MSHQSSSTSSVVVLLLQVVMIIMCYCCGLSSSEENMDLCASRDSQNLCNGSDSNGFCNQQDFDMKNPVKFQVKMLNALGHSNTCNSGKKSKCAIVSTKPPVYFYYCCDRNFEANCGDCFHRAIKRLKDGCAGRCGGSVLLDICSLRYELYDICNPDFE